MGDAGERRESAIKPPLLVFTPDISSRLSPDVF